MINKSIQQLHNGLVNKEFKAVDILSAYMKEIKDKDNTINSYLLETFDLAKEQAENIDKKIENGDKIDILAGIPMAVKDNILVRGYKCTAGSKMLEDYIAAYDATIIKRLKDKGAIILGKLNLDEFAMGSSGEYSAYGKTKNPIDIDRVPGGSSSGPAAAVAGDMAVYSLGSDTGGSIRQPASFCGVCGLKPTYGAVSRYGLISLASSLDQIGPIAKNAEDLEIVFDAIKGIDDLDSTSVDIEKKEKKEFDISKIKIGIPKEYFVEGIDDDVKKSIISAIEKFKEQGAEIKEISLPHTKYALASYQIIMTAEASSNLARYDNIRYGSDKEIKSENLDEFYCNARGELFGEEVRRRIMLGTYVLSSGYYDAYYKRAQKVRTLISNDFTNAFEEVDIILTPTSPETAFLFGQNIENPVKMYLADIYTSSVNLAGVCAVSIPCGYSGMLPIGLQIIGNFYQEKQILKAAQFFEKCQY